MKRRTFLAGALGAVAFGGTAVAQSYPQRTIKIIVPFAPGGATDVAGRVVAEALTEELRQTVIVENRPGSGGNIGVAAAAMSEADGYTLMMGTQALLTQNPHLYADLQKNPQTDLVPVAGAFKTDMIMVASPKLAAKTPKEIAALAKSKPDALNYGSAGNGSAAHVLMELFLNRTDTKIRHVPYKGTAPALVDLVVGTLDLMIDSVPSAQGQIDAGKVVPIAVCGSTRNPRFPNVPTMTETGIRDFNTVAWLAMFAPKGTPAAIVQQLDKAIKAALDKPAVVQRGSKAGLDPDYVSSEALAKRIAAESAVWSQVIKAADIRI